MTERVACSSDAFAKLDVSWRQLADAGGVCTPFQSFPWLEQWLRHRGGEVEPFVLLLPEAQTIAPFGRLRRGGVTVLRLLGTPDSDYPGLVTARPLEEAWDAVGQELSRLRRSFDVLHLHSVRERAEIIPALRRHLGPTGYVRRYEVCPWVRTDQSWEGLVADRGSGLRNELKRWKRRMEELGEVIVERTRPPLPEMILQEMEEVERSSWKWHDGAATFRPGSYRHFVEAILRDARMDAEVWLTRVSGRLVAFALVLVAADRWYYYLTSFVTDVANAGSFLLGRIIEAACRGTCTVVDLLRGDHLYKRTWTDLTETVYEAAWPVNVRGRIAAIGYAARWQAARSRRLQWLRARLLDIGDRRAVAVAHFSHGEASHADGAIRKAKEG